MRCLAVLALVLLSGCVRQTPHERAVESAARERAQTERDEAIAREQPAVEALVVKKRYGEAIDKEKALAEKSRPGSKTRTRLDQIRREAAAHYSGIAEKATTPNRRLLYGKLAQTFGGPEVPKQWIFDAESPVGVAWTLDTTRVTCRNALDRIAKAFPPVVQGTAGTPATLRVELACKSSVRNFDTDETYTYYVQESYTEDQIGTRSVPNTVYEPGHMECHQVPSTSYSGGHSSTTYSSQCTTTPGTTRTDYRTETTHTPVTRTRSVPRTGTRVVHHIEWTTLTDGRAQVSVDGSGANGPLAQSSVVEAEFSTVSETNAIEAVVARLLAIVTEAQEKRALPLVQKAEMAASVKLFDDAEDGFVSAMLETGEVSRPFASYLESRLGLPASYHEALGRKPSAPEKSALGSRK